MLDRMALDLLRPGLNGAARGLARLGVHADHVTLAGFAIGLAGAAAIASNRYPLGLDATVFISGSGSRSP